MPFVMIKNAHDIFCWVVLIALFSDSECYLLFLCFPSSISLAASMITLFHQKGNCLKQLWVSPRPWHMKNCSCWMTLNWQMLLYLGIKNFDLYSIRLAKHLLKSTTALSLCLLVAVKVFVTRFGFFKVLNLETGTNSIIPISIF